MFLNGIYTIRGEQVMIDSDLADIYGYELKAMNQQVKRNIERFPEDFMFQLNQEEIPNDYLKSQFVTLNESGNKRGLHIKKRNERPFPVRRPYSVKKPFLDSYVNGTTGDCKEQLMESR